MAAELKERVEAALKSQPNKMTMQLARELGVPEAEIIRVLPDNRAVELDLARWEELIRSFEALKTVHVIATNGAVTLEANGEFGNFSTWGEFFNVQTPTLDMHIRFKRLGAAFAVEKPSHMDGVNTHSFQFFDVEGHSAFKVFVTMGGKAPPAEKVEGFQRIRDAFKK